MRRFCALAAVAVVGGCCGWGAQAAFASSVFLCVPSTAGHSVTSDGNGSTACPSKSTRLALPAGRRDQKTLISILPPVGFIARGVGRKPTIRFTGVNVQVVSGSGNTTAKVNGTGNLVIGYDESPGPQTGSHNLILGAGQAFTSYGSIVAGLDNSASGAYSAVLGYRNHAVGTAATVTGGSAGSASGSFSSVTGGFANRASSSYGSVSGGCENLAGAGTLTSSGYCDNPYFQSVSGGYGNNADGPQSSVSGGTRGTASGTDSSILGGFGVTVTDCGGTYPTGPSPCP
jgi:hypothetical protein